MKKFALSCLALSLALFTTKISEAQIPGCASPVNLVTNGNFSSGTAGWTTEYDAFTSTCQEGEYLIGTNFNQKCSYSSYTGNGNFMIIDSYNPSSVSGDSNIWEQNISGITQNTTYTIRIRKSDLYSATAGLNIKINGTTVQTGFANPGGTNNWQYFTTTWYSGTTSGTIELAFSHNHNNSNDYGVDDIFFGLCGDCAIGDGEITFDIDKFGCTYDFSVNANVSSGGTIVGYLWNFGDGSTSTDANPSHTYTANGSYVVCVTIVVLNPFGECCTETFCTEIYVEGDCFGEGKAAPGNSGQTLQDMRDPQPFRLFPNPAQGAIQVEWDYEGESVKADVAIYDLAGKQVKSERNAFRLNEGNNRYTIDTESLSPGAYIIELKAGARSYTSQFMVSE